MINTKLIGELELRDRELKVTVNLNPIVMQAQVKHCVAEAQNIYF
jgi:hypothetical protein